jgi:hypothetical protein
MIRPSSLAFLSREGTHVGLCAAVERGPSEGARSGSTGPAWVFSHSLYCARSTFYLEGGLDGLPLRVSNEGLPRPRVARAQETV